MKTIRKVNILIALLTVLLVVACKNEDIVREPSPIVPADNQTVYFAPSNVTKYELDPAAATSVTVKLMRKDSTSAADVPIKVMKNDSNIFVIPATASFQAGKGSTTVNVTFPQSKIGINYAFELGITGDKYLNPYSTTVPVVRVSINRVQWDLVGTGQFYDDFTFASVESVKIYYSALKKQYRIPNPYTVAMLTEAGWGTKIGGPTSDYVIFQIASGKVTWTSWYIGLNYQGVAGQPYQAFFPSYLGTIRNTTSYNVDDALSIVDPSNSKLLKLYPRYYILAIPGGYSPKYPIYISLPGGPDLNALLGF